ncbi:Uncharacterized protein CTYZ_00001978 [Cryptosporidium tyzzeri]|nr:Uncharacterized protein CTYZ_00001978 [Cryptosporidium tyzzeri]
MPLNQELDQICCISTWHKETNTINLYNEELCNSKVIFPWSMGNRVPINCVSCSDPIFNCNETINSGPIGRQKLKTFLEASIQSSQIYNLSIPNISRILSDWRKENEIKNTFVMELVDFTKLCGIKKNKTYRDLFELLSKIFISKLKNKKILDYRTYTKFDDLALKCVKMINVPHLVESVIALLTKFNRLSDKVIKEITTPDLYLFPRFLYFYKLAPIKLRQQMWLRRPRWFVYEIIPLVILFTKIFSNVDYCSIFNISNPRNSNDKNSSFDLIREFLRSAQIDSRGNAGSDLKTEIDSFFFEFVKRNECCSLYERKFSQQTNSIDSIYTFVSRIQSLYVSCVEIEHENIERLGESCKSLAFNFMDSGDFYKSFIQLQKDELLLPENSISASISTNFCSAIHNISSIPKINNVSSHSLHSNPLINGRSINNNLSNNSIINSSCCNMTICGNILRLGRIVAYISYCIGNYKELYIYFVNTLRQLYIDSLSHNIDIQAVQTDLITCVNQIPECSNNTNNSINSNSINPHIHFLSQINSISQNNKASKIPTNKLLNGSRLEGDFSNAEEFHRRNAPNNIDCRQENSFLLGDKKKIISKLNEQRLNNFSGEPYLSSLRIFVALRIFHFNNKLNKSEEEEKKLIENEKSNLMNNNSEFNSEKSNQTELSNFEALSPLAISECDPIAWPCIHIVGNILRDGFSSNKSQESLVNISSTLIIKSKDDLSDISFIFSEPHFLFICSEFILETSILTMFHSSMDAMLVLNPQRRKIPIALISLGLNSPFLSFKNKNSLLRNSSFLTNSSTNSISSSIAANSINNQFVGKSASRSISTFRKIISNDLNSQNNSLSTIPRKRYRKNTNDAATIQNNIENNQVSFAIRFDTLLNLLTTFNLNKAQIKENPQIIDAGDCSYLPNITQLMDLKDKKKIDVSFQQTTFCHVSSTIDSNIPRLHNTVFSTFLPLIDRYLELSISSQKSNFTFQNNECEKKKSTRNELLKSIRNELIGYINSISALKYQNYSDILTLKFVRIVSTSLFFTGVKPIIKQESFSVNPLIHYSINGLSYYHSHHTQTKKNPDISLNSQIIAPSLPSCINLSIRLLETSFSSDWINKIFLKSIFGLLHTYPRVYNRFDNPNMKGENEVFAETVSYMNDKSSLFASIPNDIIHGLLLRVVLPSIKDPSISSTEINTIYEIINDAEICSLVDTKTKKLFIERFWLLNPFHFSINISNDKKDQYELKNSPKIQINDLFQFIQNKLCKNEVNFYITIEAPYKTMLWEHHFINSNDCYLLFQRWFLYFVNVCKNHDRDNQYYNKLLSLSELIKNIDGDK